MALGKFGSLFSFILLTAFVAVFMQTLIQMGYFKVLLNHSPGPCRVIQVDGSEDVDVLPDGLAFISSGLQWPGADPIVNTRKGKLLLFNFNNSDTDPLELTLKSFDSSSFNPHGLSLYSDPESNIVFVFAINHKSDGDVVEIFEFDREEQSLIHRRSITDKKIYSGNDLVAVGPSSFYITNTFSSLGTRFVLARMVEVMLPLSLGNVVYYNGERSQTVATGIMLANGINTDPSRRYIYVSSTMGGHVNVYERREDNTLTNLQKFPLGFGSDNINVDVTNGDLWIAGTARGLDFVPYSKNLSLPCSSQVVRLRVNNLPQSSSSRKSPVFQYEARDVYVNDGRQLKASSAAAHYQGKMLVGTVFDNLLFCELHAY